MFKSKETGKLYLMKYRDLQIQTQRETPNNARTQGFGWLVRAEYMTREGEILPLGKQAIARLQLLSVDPAFISRLSLAVIETEDGVYFRLSLL